MANLYLIFSIFFLTVTIGYADDTDGDLQIVPRSEWGATKPRHPAAPLSTLPPTYAIVSHTGAGAGCHSRDSCLNHLRNVQAMHVGQLGYPDVGYNFLVGGDGSVYEGRGWDVEGHVEAAAGGLNDKSLWVGFVGDFGFRSPTPEQLEAARKLLKFAVEHGKLARAYKLLGHNQVAIGVKSGAKLYEAIKAWEHWSEKP